MNIRELSEEKEYTYLSPFGAKSRDSKGRQNFEEECDIRTAYQRDRDRIIHSKAFRRLIHKTQVFIAPEGDHFRTRLTHTLEVAQIARTVAKALSLNEDLTEAIALGHDLGHTPFGHAGEQVLHEILPGGFQHNEQSLRVVDFLERNTGLNLTFEVRDGILNHTGPRKPDTLEGQIVKIADRIAYINHDIDDAIRAGIITFTELPHEIIRILGETHSKRIDTMNKDMIFNSLNQPEIKMSNEVENAMLALREYLFKNVYIGSTAKKEEYKAKKMLKMLFEYYVANPEKIDNERFETGEQIEQAVADYLAGMTDRYAVKLFMKNFVPQGFGD